MKYGVPHSKPIHILTTLLFCCLALSGLSSWAKEKIVRVGWYDSAYNLIDKQGRRSGYGYEYQRRIAANTDGNTNTWRAPGLTFWTNSSEAR